MVLKSLINFILTLCYLSNGLYLFIITVNKKKRYLLNILTAMLLNRDKPILYVNI